MDAGHGLHLPNHPGPADQPDRLQENQGLRTDRHLHAPLHLRGGHRLDAQHLPVPGLRHPGPLLRRRIADGLHQRHHRRLLDLRSLAARRLELHHLPGRARRCGHLAVRGREDRWRRPSATDPLRRPAGDHADLRNPAHHEHGFRAQRGFRQDLPDAEFAEYAGHRGHRDLHLQDRYY